MYICGMKRRTYMWRHHRHNTDIATSVMKTERDGSKGIALLEVCLITPLFLLLFAGLVQIGITMLTAYNLVTAAREGARVASALPILVVDDTRVRDFVMPKIALSRIYTNIIITNSVPTSNGTLNNQDGMNCARSVSVTVTMRVLMPFQAVFGYPYVDMSRSTSMRYLQQPLCS